MTASTTSSGGQTITAALGEARTHSGYWLLNAGFFVCGFHVTFVATHLPAYLADKGLSPSVSAWSLAMIGLFNIFGSYLFGALGGRYRQKWVLAAIYLARAGVIGLFLLLPLTGASAIAFGAGIGFLWLGTVPLTSGLVARVFGVRYLSMLYGVVFASHQLGAFLGAWGGGWAYDALGCMSLIWLASIALALFAAAVHIPIRDRRCRDCVRRCRDGNENRRTPTRRSTDRRRPGAVVALRPRHRARRPDLVLLLALVTVPRR